MLFIRKNLGVKAVEIAMEESKARKIKNDSALEKEIESLKNMKRDKDQEIEASVKKNQYLMEKLDEARK